MVLYQSSLTFHRLGFLNMSDEKKLAEESSVELSEVEEHDFETHVAQRTPVIFEIIRRSGEEELNRPWFSLWWSGLAAGLSMGFSMLGQALLHVHLPIAESSILLEKFSYCVGFIIVILAHQQLFTENTLTAVVPLMAHPHWQNFFRVSRLWGIVLAANVVGATLFSTFIFFSDAITPITRAALHEICFKTVHLSTPDLVVRGIMAGFLIASLVWILSNVEDSKFLIIILMTYLIALGDFTHIIAGSVEAAYLVMDGTLTVEHALTGFFVPALVGNLLGGTGLFALLAYGQTHQELKSNPSPP